MLKMIVLSPGYCHSAHMKTSIHRRQFLKLMGTSFLSFLLQQCGIRPTLPEHPPERSHLHRRRSPFCPSATAVPSQTATSQPTATPNPQTTAAIGQINTYEVSQLRQKLQDMFQQLGGLADVIRPGARVTIKPNLTGGTWSDSSITCADDRTFRYASGIGAGPV